MNKQSPRWLLPAMKASTRFQTEEEQKRIQEHLDELIDGLDVKGRLGA